MTATAGSSGSARAAALSVTTTPGLFPEFSPTVHDYVTRCTADPIEVRIDAPSGTAISVDERRPRGGAFTVPVALGAGQEFTIVSTSRGGYRTDRYFVRCLPADFPNYTFTRSGTAKLRFFVVAPGLGRPEPASSPNYVAVFDRFGVPVWWYQAPLQPIKRSDPPGRNGGRVVSPLRLLRHPRGVRRP